MTRKPPVDDEFVDFVRARQHELRRTAYLLCGDLSRADQALAGAFGELRRRWRRIEDEQPDVVVRRALLRRVPAAPTAWPGPDELAALSPRERAVAVFRRFEERAEPEVAAVLRTSVASLRHHERAVSRDALLDAAADVGERDFTGLAAQEAQAQRRRSRHRVLVAAGVLIAAGLVLSLVNNNGAEREALPAPRPSPPSLRASPTDSGEWTSVERDVFGVLAQVGPGAAQVWALPEVDDLTRRQLALPPVLQVPTGALPSLASVGSNSAPVRAVLLRHTGAAWQPVLYRPTLSKAPYSLLDSVLLQQVVDQGGNGADPLVVRAIADDRRHVLFVQPNRALVLDAFSGAVTSYDVPDRYLQNGGWVPDGNSFLVWSADRTWRITPARDEVRQVTVSSSDLHQVRVDPPDGMRILTFRADGSTSSTQTGPRVLSAAAEDTLTGDGGGFAVSGLLSAAAGQQLRTSGPSEFTSVVFSSGGANPGFGRLLIADQDEMFSGGEVLGWAYNDNVLLRWGRTHLLAWDTRTGELARLSELPPVDGDLRSPGLISGSVAIAP